MEIRLHGRGGQGGVTCAKLLAAAYALEGKSVQTFGDYASERSGAPVRAYTRVADEPVTSRNKVYTPDHLVVLDPLLLGADTVAGLAPGGTLLLNTPRPIEEWAEELGPWRLAAVDATAIARRHGIGTRSVVIVNTTLAGAFARVHGLAWETLERAYRSLGFESNLPAALEAFDAVRVRPPVPGASVPEAAPPPRSAEVEPIPEHVSSPPSGVRTGAWSTQRPVHVDHLAPCSAWCPAGNDVVGFVRALATDGEEAAARVLARTTPLPGVCGRVCPAPCMEGCNRAEYDGAVNIRALERWVADHAPAPRPERRTSRSGHVAVVGGGPAGLAAAFTLATAGRRPRIYESEPVLGGVLATGIPAYRLPRDVVEREVRAVLDLGVEARLGQRVTADRLTSMRLDYDAVVLATGLQRLREPDVPGAELAGVRQGIRFLHAVNGDEPPELSGHVVVLGGGNAAVDCARSALRAGAERVTIAYRRTRAEMPAIREEVDEALAEGVQLLELAAPAAFRGQGRVRAVELAEVELGEPDETGRRAPRVTERTSALDCDHVLLALGQTPDTSFLPVGWQVVAGQVRRGREPLNVFVAGDLATGDGTVAHAIGSGRRAATLVLRWLGAGGEVFERPDRSAAVPVTDIRLDHFERVAPARDRVELGAARATALDEVNLGLADALEAHRCFSCGHCTRCDTCLVYCPEGIVRREEDGYEVDYTYCKGCGICVQECPRKAMEMTAT